MINDLAWAIFSYKIHVLKSLFHFIVAKVKPVVSLQWYNFAIPSHFFGKQLQSPFQRNIYSNMSNTGGIIGESEYTMLMSCLNMCLALVHMIILKFSYSLKSWAGFRVGVKPRLRDFFFLLPEHHPQFRIPTERSWIEDSSSTAPKWQTLQKTKLLVLTEQSPCKAQILH